MAVSLSPAKLVLLAVHLAVKADIDSLTALAARHDTILRKDLLLRIILTYLPETLQSSKYVGLVERLETGNFPDTTTQSIDCASVEGLAEEDATKKVRKLHLLPLKFPDRPEDDPLTLFLLRRSYKVDEEAGLLDELPSLLLPFLDHSPYVRTLLISTILPLLRRNCEYHPQEPVQYTLSAFEQLPDRVAVNLLLSQTGSSEENLHLVGRDLKGLVGPWLYDEKKWRHRKQSNRPGGDDDDGICPGWDELLRWLTTQASKSWKVAASAILQWDGPKDADLAGWGVLRLSDQQEEHVEEEYARAALASAYLVPEASIEALECAYNIAAKVATLRDLEPLAPLSSALALLPPLTEQITDDIILARNATYMRNDLLSNSNPLTSPTSAPTTFLQALVLSAHILIKAGCACTVRKAGELALLQDEREQKTEAVKLIHAIINNGPKSDDKFWIRARNEILWLRDWGAEEAAWAEATPNGIFSQLKKEFLEIEILKALLSNTRYELARSLYEDSPDHTITTKLLQDTIQAAAMAAYDNSSNPNRTRGGLKKCDDIMKSFPKTIEKSDAIAKRIEALLQATHALSEYRLVLKQGEPFTPIVLRVHSDPISIIEKILEQNPKSYTRIQDLLDLGARMVQAGLTTKDKPLLSKEEEAVHRANAERRITALCIDTALTEDDFETAYSYVVNRLSSFKHPVAASQDDYSWKAALQAGNYRRTARTVRPTHLGNSSANPDIRHLEQRIECLATALRIAPTPTLQQILNAFRRAEEELDAALKAEQEQEDEWDSRGDTIHGMQGMPGGFNTTAPAASRNTTRAATSSSSRRQQSEEAVPMSLFDLARASTLSAQKNISALSGLQRSVGFGLGGGLGGGGRTSMDSTNAAEHSVAGSDDNGGEDTHKRARKRDQLKNAAMGTLVSGVGWLVGAPAAAPGRE
ncbi:protein transport protein sec39 [Cladorrhinum sp. PSN332]|nr:protein transport protein sec39 [Cladorrhinum sp. PSN332]